MDLMSFLLGLILGGAIGWLWNPLVKAFNVMRSEAYKQKMMPNPGQALRQGQYPQNQYPNNNNQDRPPQVV